MLYNIKHTYRFSFYYIVNACKNTFYNKEALVILISPFKQSKPKLSKIYSLIIPLKLVLLLIKMDIH
jgi:hypothetical protein